MQVSRGFLRPSLEETLAFNRSRSIVVEEEAEVVGTYRIRFFCLSFVFLFFFFIVFPCPFFCLSLIFACMLLLYVGMPVPLSLDFFCYGWPRC